MSDSQSLASISTIGGILSGGIGTFFGFFLKSLWDRHWKKHDEAETLKRNKRLDFLEKQLFEFYVPIYMRLQKDNVVWLKVYDRPKNDNMKRQVAISIESNFILPNHYEIIKIIESKYHLARADDDLSQQIFAYIKHMAVFKALRECGVLDVDPIELGEPFPKKLFSLIERKVSDLQEEYDTLLNMESRSKSDYYFSLKNECLNFKQNIARYCNRDTLHKIIGKYL